jgi:26S proteasome regulatory subunit N7
MAPLYRHLAHPVEGILNGSGEGVSQQSTAASKSSVVNSNLLVGIRGFQKINFPWDEKLYESLVEANKKEVEALQKEEDDAAEAAGETEVQAARGKRAEFWARVGDKVGIFFLKTAYENVLKFLTCADFWMTIFRIRLFHLTKRYLRKPACLERRSILFLLSYGLDCSSATSSL